MLELRTSTAFVLAILLTGCGRVVFEWQGPTDHFRGLDANSDRAVDRFEWEKVQGSTFKKTQGFRSADCDSNGRLTWHEYFVGYMHLEHCPGSYLYEPPLDPSPDTGATYAYAYSEGDDWPDNWQQGTLLVRADENVQIYEQMPSGSEDVPTLIAPRLKPPPGRYSEQDLPPAAQQKVRFSSVPLENRVLVAHYDPVERVPGNEDRGTFPHVSCEVGNDNADVRITMADLQVVWRSGEHTDLERWIKPVWIEPGSSVSLDVWFGSAVDSAECRLLHARGQPVSR